MPIANAHQTAQSPVIRPKAWKGAYAVARKGQRVCDFRVDEAEMNVADDAAVHNGYKLHPAVAGRSLGEADERGAHACNQVEEGENALCRIHYVRG